MKNLKNLLKTARKHEANLTPGKWTADECGSENCWCKVIGDNTEHGVCPSGCLSKNDAESLVWIRNNFLKIIDLLEKLDKGN